MSGVRKLIAIVGPTASGKTALAIDLARRLGGEIVGADSRQVYRRMDIGTAKPTASEQAAVRHHLIDVVDPDEPFSLERWLDLAHRALDEIWSRNNLPLLVGGAGQYVWALVEGWRVPRVEPQADLRAEMASWTAQELLAELRRVDPEAERFVDPRNARRMVRVLEVYRVTGKPFSYWRAKAPPEFDTLVIGPKVTRSELYRRIDVRLDAMVAAGFVDEVRSLLAAGYSRELPAMSGIGYKEVCEHLAGGTGLAAAVARTKTGTHRLARHQNSWFKASDERIQWVETREEAWDLARAFMRASQAVRRKRWQAL